MINMEKWLEEHRGKERDLVKDPRVKALQVIDMLTCNDEFGNSKLLSTIYRVAHSATGICDNKHEDWLAETEKLYGELKGS